MICELSTAHMLYDALLLGSWLLTFFIIVVVSEL